MSSRNRKGSKLYSSSEDERDSVDEFYSKARKKVKKNKSHNQKLKANYFFEEEASEDEEEDELSDDDDYVAINQAERRQAQEEREKWERNYGKKKNVYEPNFLKIQNDEDVEDYFRQMKESQDLNLNNELAMLPSNSDPRMYAVACIPTFEKQCCLDVYKRYFEFKGTKEEFQIFSVTTVEKIPGFIYIEAYTNKPVYLAVTGINYLNSRKVQLVEFKDRTQIFEPNPVMKYDVKEGQWVRMQKGLYAGDLAQVIDVNEANGKAFIKVIPRLTDEMGGDTIKEETELVRGKYGFYRRKKSDRQMIRPEPRLFQESEHQGVNMHRDMKRGVQFVTWDGDKYLNGFLCLTVPLKSLTIKDVVPTYTELKKFSLDEDDPKMLQSILDQKTAMSKKLFVGDIIKVIKGDLQNLEAEIIKIDEKLITARPTNTDFKDTVEILPDDCVKSFKKNDYVKIIDGKNKGKEGYIMKIEETTAEVLVDGLKKKISAFLNDLIKGNSLGGAAASSTGDKILDSYSKHDLVKLNDLKSVGVVLSKGKYGLKILDSSGRISQIRLLDVNERIRTKFFKSKNKLGHVFKQGDSVRVLEGRYKGSVGEILHVYDTVLFLYGVDFNIHAACNGCAVEKANNCFILNSNIERNPMVKAKDSLVGKEVFIVSGIHKGYKGIVRNETERVMTVELIARCMKVDVPRSDVCLPEDLEIPGRNSVDWKNDPKTPIYGKSLQSPMFISSPGYINSPGWGGFESPAYSSKL